MTFAFTTDYRLIRKILSDPRCFSRMAPDGAPEPCELNPEVDGIRYVLGTEGGETQCLFLLLHDVEHPEWVALHFCFVPHAWGRALEISRDFMEWLWAETDTEMALGSVPGYNRLALRLAQAVGFSEIRRDQDAVMKHGKAFDLIHTVIERPVAA